MPVDKSREKAAFLGRFAPSRRDALKLLLGSAAIMMPWRARAAAHKRWSYPRYIAPPSTFFGANSYYNASFPFVATGGNGDSVAVWYIPDDSSDIGLFHGARLAASDVGSAHPFPWRQTSQIASAATDPFDPQAVSVGMDARGNAMAAWTDGDNNILAAFLNHAGTHWSSHVPINSKLAGESVSPPTVAVAPNGNAVVIWTRYASLYVYSLFANSFDAAKNKWRGQQPLFSGATFADSQVNIVGVDPVGNAVAVVGDSENSIMTAALDFAANKWRTVAPISVPGMPYLAELAVDQAGNATIIWLAFNNVNNLFTLHAAQLPHGNQSAFVNEKFLATGAGFNDSLPQLAVDGKGNVLAAWPTAAGGIEAAWRPFNSNAWSRIARLDLKEANGPASLGLAVDAAGNAVLVWTSSDQTPNRLEAAMLSTKLGRHTNRSWKRLPDITNYTGSFQNAQVTITPTGDAVVVWENDINQDTSFSGIIAWSVYPGLFPA